jgi:hypothetical protein
MEAGGIGSCSTDGAVDVGASATAGVNARRAVMRATMREREMRDDDGTSVTSCAARILVVWRRLGRSLSTCDRLEYREVLLFLSIFLYGFVT